MSPRANLPIHIRKIDLFRLAIFIFALFTCSFIFPTGSTSPKESSGLLPQDPGTRRSVILISWSGVGFRPLAKLLDEGRLPNLKSLIEEGSIAKIKVVGHKTEGAPGHAEMLTGYPPSVTGISSALSLKKVPTGLTIPERLKTLLGSNMKIVVVLGAVVPKRNGIASVSRDWLGDEIVLSPDIVTRVLRLRRRKAEEVGRLAGKYLSQIDGERCFGFIHFVDPDVAGHKFGEGSTQYLDAVVTLDVELGRIRKTLGELGMDKRTIIIVTSDHGFDEGKREHKHADGVFIASNLPSKLKDGTQGDLAPTIYELLGIDWKEFSPPLPGRSLLRGGR